MNKYVEILDNRQNHLRYKANLEARPWRGQ